MELPIIVLAYVAAAVVASLTTAGFSRAIDRVLVRLIPVEIVSSWTLFIKFALFVVTFTGGMPPSDVGKFVGFQTPAVVPPVPGDGTMFVMRSVGAALLSASWFLVVFFGVTLTAGAGARLITAVREKREKDAREAEALKQAHPTPNEALKKEAAAEEPPKRPEAEGRRPVKKEEPARPVHK